MRYPISFSHALLLFINPILHFILKCPTIAHKSNDKMSYYISFSRCPSIGCSEVSFAKEPCAKEPCAKCPTTFHSQDVLVWGGYNE